MQINCEAIKQDIEKLSVEQLQQVADFIAFLKFQDKYRVGAIDPSQLASLATEFAEEDKALAEAGMSDYAVMLDSEDRL
ncbi:MAG: hypothetical protein AAGE84_27885 [Cyanobacteria bacterium P01_G01_bin.39]